MYNYTRNNTLYVLVEFIPSFIRPSSFFKPNDISVTQVATLLHSLFSIW